MNSAPWLLIPSIYRPTEKKHAYNAILANNLYICISSLTIAFIKEGNLYSYRRIFTPQTPLKGALTASALCIKVLPSGRI
jgi:hypothetical protein